MVYLQLRVKLPDTALLPLLRTMEHWYLGLMPDEQSDVQAAVVLEATALTGPQLAALFAQLSWRLPWRRLARWGERLKDWLIVEEGSR